MNNTMRQSTEPSKDTSKSPPQGVIVLGMHRSGTSATTRVINLLGVAVNSPDDWMDLDPINPKGFWESSRLKEINDELMSLFGFNCWSPPVLPFGWEHSAALHPLCARARSLFRSVFPARQWVWKDPRNCITLPFWMHVLDLRPVVVFTYRN